MFSYVSIDESTGAPRGTTARRYFPKVWKYAKCGDTFSGETNHPRENPGIEKEPPPMKKMIANPAT